MNQSVKDQADFLLFRLDRNAALSKRPDGKFIGRTEKRLILKLKKYWKGQMDYVLEKTKFISAFKQNNIAANTIEDDADWIVNNLPYRTEIAETIVLNMKTSLERGGKMVVKKMKLGQFGISFDIKNKRAIEFLKAKKTLELSNSRGNINGTTKERIAAILTKAAKSGQSYEETAKLIIEQGNAGVFSPARAQLIATREIGVAYEEGNREPIDEFSEKYPDREVKKYWQTVGDDRVTPECEANEDEGWIGLDEDFPSGDQQAPRDGNPRCRCTTLYEIQSP